jgi:hypothetical protein
VPQESVRCGVRSQLPPSHSWGSLALGGLVLLAFRGCPICWSIGLFETAGEASKRRRDLNRRSAMDRAAP